MRAHEIISELVTRADTTDHLIKRIKYAAQLCQQMGDVPLLFREFKTGIPYETVLAKVINDTEKEGPRAPVYVRGGIGKVDQTAILNKLGIQNPVFTQMSPPASDWGFHGDPHIFIPLPGSKAVWSPRIVDLGGISHINDKGNAVKGGSIPDPKRPGMYKSSNLRLNDVDKWAQTYQQGVPNQYTKHEIIFDSDYYYLLNVKSFLTRFAGKINKTSLSQNRSSPSQQIDPLLWTESIRTYSDVARFLLTDGVSYVKWYQEKVEKPRNAMPQRAAQSAENPTDARPAALSKITPNNDVA